MGNGIDFQDVVMAKIGKVSRFVPEKWLRMEIFHAKWEINFQKGRLTRGRDDCFDII
jgi:hypothetical protein